MTSLITRHHWKRAARLTLAATLSSVILAAAPTALLAQSKDGPPPDGKEATGPDEMGHVGRLDATNGFRGVKFGTEFSTFKDLAVDKDMGACKTYTKTGEKLTLGPVKLEHIVYHFVDNKFSGVSLYTEDGHDSSMLLRISQFAFGVGAEPSPSQPEYFWTGKVALARYSEQPTSGQAMLFIGNIELCDKAEEIELKATQAAAKEL